MATAQTPLSADRLLELMKSSLPSTNAVSNIQDPYSAIALLCHACMISVDFRLIGLGEDHKIEAQSELTDVQTLPSEWNASSTYAFRYKHSQSSMEYLVKVTRLGGKAIIYGVGIGHDKTASFEIKAEDYTSPGSIKEPEGEDTKQQLKNIFISAGRISDLAGKFQSEIIQKLIPGLYKEGYQETAQTREVPLRPEAAPTREPRRDYDDPQPARPHPLSDPLALPPRRPGPVPDFQPPGFEDEYELNRPPRGMGFGGQQPFGRIGEQDLYPPGLGPHDPLRIGPGGGHRGGGGMHPTFDDPIFGGPGGAQGGFDPRAPPGARYDPIGPGDGPPNLRGGPRFPGGGGGRPPNPFGGYGSGDFI